MTTDEQQELASLYVLGALSGEEQQSFEAELRTNAGLQELVRSLQGAAALLALSVPPVAPPAGLKQKVLQRIDARSSAPGQVVAPSASPRPGLPGFLFHAAADSKGWKELPVPGAWIKLLSIERARGYAVLLGRLEAGVRYPAHQHTGPEELYVLTGDLQIGNRALGPGDFHHADAGTAHEINSSIDGCTLLAVLPAEHELVQFAMA